MSRRRVFVSSVQSELQDHRLAIANLFTIDPFLHEHGEAVLYEVEPASPKKAVKECLELIDGCEAYVLIVGDQYGYEFDELSITHHEYRRAKERELPILIFIRGARDTGREKSVREKLLAEIKKDGFKYKRFGDIGQMQQEVRRSLLKVFRDEFQIEPTSDENQLGSDAVESASGFGLRQIDQVPWTALDLKLCRRFISGADGVSAARMSRENVRERLRRRGLVWHDSSRDEDFPTAAALLLLGSDPAAVLPQSRIMLDAYRGTKRTHRPDDSHQVNGPLPLAIGEIVDFVWKNTRHPIRVVALTQVKLNEYPEEALREALVNAVAHRDYEQEGQRISVEVFKDRVVISSPGLPPKPVTLSKLRSGNYRPSSRNPLIAFGLSFFEKIEERGSGIRRMHAEMLDHGLDPPRFGTDSGHFVVTLAGPGDDLDRIRTPGDVSSNVVPPSVEEQLNDRQRQIVEVMLQGEAVTSGWCIETFGVTRDTSARDLKELVKLGIAARKGAGRSTRYVLRGAGESSDNRQTAS